jgi:hypothetical protein
MKTSNVFVFSILMAMSTLPAFSDDATKVGVDQSSKRILSQEPKSTGYKIKRIDEPNGNSIELYIQEIAPSVAAPVKLSTPPQL